MGEILVSLIIVAITAIGILVLFIFLGQRKKQTYQMLEQSAKENGWIIERIEKPLLSGYRVTGRMIEGNWTLEAIAKSSSTESGPGSSEFSKTTEWFSPDCKSRKGAFVFGPALGPVTKMSTMNLGSTIIQMALQLMIGKDEDWALSLEQVDINNSMMGKKFLAFTDTPSEINSIITPEVERAINVLPQKIIPVIVWNQKGLTIKAINQQYLNPEEWKVIIDLGKNLMREWSRIS